MRVVAARLGVTSVVRTHSIPEQGRDTKAGIASAADGPLMVLLSAELPDGGRAVFGGITSVAVSVPASGDEWFTDARAALVSVQCPGRLGECVRLAKVKEGEAKT